MLGFPRHLSESYDFSPTNNALTIDQWIEVKVKDAKYRARCLDLMSTLNHGGSPFGIRMGCKAVLGVDCDVFELWKYIDSPTYRSGLRTNGTGTATTPHATAFNLSTGFSVIVKLRSDLFSSGNIMLLVGKWNPTGNQRSWTLRINSTGFPEIATSVTGSSTVSLFTSSAVLPTTLQGRDFYLRASFTPNNGSNSVATYGYSLDGVTWTTLGTTITFSTTTFFTSTSAVAVGSAVDGTFSFNGNIYNASIYSDLLWTTLVSAPNFTNNTSGAISFTDAHKALSGQWPRRLC